MHYFTGRRCGRDTGDAFRPYDFIFMDAAKGQYIHYMPEAVRLLSEGGILMSDNVLQDGDIIESRFVGREAETVPSTAVCGITSMN